MLISFQEIDTQSDTSEVTILNAADDTFHDWIDPNDVPVFVLACFWPLRGSDLK